MLVSHSMLKYVIVYYGDIVDYGRQGYGPNSSCPGAQHRISLASCREEAKGSDEDKGSQEGDGPGFFLGLGFRV